MLIHTPHFTIRVWGSAGSTHHRLAELRRDPSRGRVPIAEIDLDPTFEGPLTITGHRGLEIVPQKMLPPVPEQSTLWHQEER